jgi:hypothetical protein
MLSGCVGLAVFYPTESTRVDPSTGYKKGANYQDMEKAPTNCTELEGHLGEPNLRSTNGNERTLVYRTGFVWAGVVPMVVLPIPLILPVGRKHSTFLCRDNVLIKASGTTTGLSGAYCGYTNAQFDFGCSWEDSKF